MQEASIQELEHSPTPDVEGEDNDSYDIDMENYPLDSLIIRTHTYTIHQLCRRIDRDLYIINYDFQRSFVWSEKKQSRLIESILMRIPLPAFYLSESFDGKTIVIDGLQRLITIQRFLRNEFSLSNLAKAHADLKGKRFNELSRKLQNRIEDTQLIHYILEESIPDKIKFDIFQRVNEATPLTRQQMRNCIYSGPATRLLKELAESEDFLSATAGGLSAKSMRDREVINRFLAFQILPFEDYRGDMDAFLAEALTEINKNFTNMGIENLKDKFLLSMRNNQNVWDKHAFRKHENAKEGRNIINIALFDVLAYYFSEIPEQLAKNHAPALRKNLITLFQNEDFHSSITYSTNDVKNVYTRFELIKSIFPEEMQCYIQ